MNHLVVTSFLKENIKAFESLHIDLHAGQNIYIRSKEHDRVKTCQFFNQLRYHHRP